jgi:hypothetical protein
VSLGQVFLLVFCFLLLISVHQCSILMHLFISNSIFLAIYLQLELNILTSHTVKTKYKDRNLVAFSRVLTVPCQLLHSWPCCPMFSSSTVLLHVHLRQPLLLLPWRYQSIAVLCCFLWCLKCTANPFTLFFSFAQQLIFV